MLPKLCVWPRYLYTPVMSLKMHEVPTPPPAGVAFEESQLLLPLAPYSVLASA